MRETDEIPSWERGRLAEEIALQFLLERGLILRERNWRHGHCEIDLIMESREKIHIVEVRSLSEPSAVLPHETVIRKKQRRLIKTANSYILRANVDKEVGFDILSVLFRCSKIKVEYIPDAFIPFC